MLMYGFGVLGYVIAVSVAIFSFLKTMQADPTTSRFVVWLQLLVYYLRFWVLWLFVWANLQLLMNNHALYWLILGLCLLYMYMTWVEPNRLRILHQSIDLTNTGNLNKQPKPPLLKLAVIGDVHIGIFHQKQQQERWVKTLNRLDVDAVLFTGDWLYHAGADLVGTMMLFRAINKPCYTTLSQADSEQQGKFSDIIPNVNLTDVLDILNIQTLNNQITMINGVTIIGLSPDDYPKNNNKTAIYQWLDKNPNTPNVIIAHDIKTCQANQQFTNKLTNKSLVIAGQSHGGQVNLPVITKKILQAMTGSGYLSGYYPRNCSIDRFTKTSALPKLNYHIWINTGVGMTGLPFRLNCPPQIDVLLLR
ncbi:hypothetical protein MOMA_01295 [Moraxella macacae 0408225]|uniref:Calcineurin-like phosphoesterase domain-containing protein n=1 Tax=Moraxella macacae 0408225 TaxID=1230338 RepID=L2F7J8_9GAMM|nr:metallophosphoesterase [Moraxella macacae]ELA09002.1 hypothetical protein MOMA_01295 [Moraxella macacae 0408225]